MVMVRRGASSSSAVVKSLIINIYFHKGDTSYPRRRKRFQLSRNGFIGLLSIVVVIVRHDFQLLGGVEGAKDLDKENQDWNEEINQANKAGLFLKQSLDGLEQERCNKHDVLLGPRLDY